jgi:hypothetical protein
VNYPLNEGARGAITPHDLPPGTHADRFNSWYGSYFSPEGEALERRALPPWYEHGTGDLLESPPAYHTFEVGPRGATAREGEINRAFNQVGGGTQWQFNPSAQNPHGMSVNQLVGDGTLVPQESMHMYNATPAEHAEVMGAVADHEAAQAAGHSGPITGHVSPVDPQGRHLPLFPDTVAIEDASPAERAEILAAAAHH